MKTFKLNFKNNLNKIDFVLIDANNKGEAMEIFATETKKPEVMISIQDVTGMFVDTNGVVK